MNERAYTKTARKKMDAIEREIRKIEERRRLLGRRLEEVAAGQSPIKPGSIITWDSGNTKRRGRVISVQSNYRGFEYRCHVLSKAGKEIGYANVHSERCPTLEGRG